MDADTDYSDSESYDSDDNDRVSGISARRVRLESLGKLLPRRRVRPSTPRTVRSSRPVKPVKPRSRKRKNITGNVAGFGSKLFGAFGETCDINI